MEAKATIDCEVKDDGQTIIDVLKEIAEKTGYELDIEADGNTCINIYYEKDQPKKIFIRSNTVNEDPICRIKYPHSCKICDN